MINLKKRLTFNRLKNRRKLHLLHKSLNKKKQQDNGKKPSDDLRVEDTFNLKTGYLPKTQYKKPLLIATFSNSCEEVPTINVLERSKLSSLHLTKRKFKLKLFNNRLIKRSTPNSPINLECVKNIRSIKNLTEKNADVKVIFHNKNTIRSFPIKKENRKQSKITGENPLQRKVIRFNPNYSFTINPFPTLEKSECQEDIVNIKQLKPGEDDSKKVDLKAPDKNNIREPTIQVVYHKIWKQVFP